MEFLGRLWDTDTMDLIVDRHTLHKSMHREATSTI